MTAGIVLSSIFMAISLTITVLFFTALKKKPYSKFAGASTAVYASACLMILLLAIFKKDLPILFFILADVLATMVCGMITAMMIVLFTKTTPVETTKPKEDEDVEDKTE